MGLACGAFLAAGAFPAAGSGRAEVTARVDEAEPGQDGRETRAGAAVRCMGRLRVLS